MTLPAQDAILHHIDSAAIEERLKNVLRKMTRHATPEQHEALAALLDESVEAREPEGTTEFTLEQLKEDFKKWSGGFSPESEHQITVYCDYAMPKDWNKNRAATLLEEWYEQGDELDEFVEQTHAESRAEELGRWGKESDTEAVNPSPICVEHLVVYYDPQRGDKPFCVDQEYADSPDGTKNPGDSGTRYATPAEAGRYVEGWLEEDKAQRGETG